MVCRSARAKRRWLRVTTDAKLSGTLIASPSDLPPVGPRHLQADGTRPGAVVGAAHRVGVAAVDGVERQSRGLLETPRHRIVELPFDMQVDSSLRQRLRRNLHLGAI